MRIRLALNALIKYLLGVLLFALLLFLPAGTLSFFNGWLLIGLLFIPMLLLGVFLLIRSPELLRRRLESREEGKTQRGVVRFSALIFLIGFLLAGVDFRFGWSRMPLTVVIVASVLLLCSYGLYAEVMRENVYLARTVRVEKGQKVIDTGLYGIVRHPMYFACLLLFLSFPLVLGSFWAFICFLVFIPLFVIRILDEEKLLVKELPGYEEYRKKVRYRLIPFVW